MDNIETAIRDAIVEKYFQPERLLQPVSVMSDGTSRVEYHPTELPSPMSRVARAIWDNNKDAITNAVLARLDLDDVVQQCSAVITKEVVARLTAEHGWSARPQASQRKQMLEKVYAMVAEEFGRQAVEHLRNTGGLMGVLEAAQEQS